MKFISISVSLLALSLNLGCKTAANKNDADVKRIPGTTTFDVKFDDVASAIATKANLRKLSGLDTYTADYRLFTPGVFSSSRNGDAKSVFKNTFYSIENDGLDKAIKNIIIHDASGGSIPFVEFTFAVIEFASQGVSRGQYGTHVKLFKGDGGKVNVITDIEAFNSGFQPKSTPISFTLNASQLVLTYTESSSGSFQPGTYQLVVKLGDTLDTTLSLKNGSGFQEVAHFTGGKKVQPGDPK